MTDVSAYPADIKSGSGTFLIRKVFSVRRPQWEETYRDALGTSDCGHREEGGGQAVHVPRRKRNPLCKSGKREKRRERERRDKRDGDDAKWQGIRGGSDGVVEGVYYVR